MAEEKYDSTRDSILGDKLFLFVKDGADTLPIALGTSCGVDLSADVIEASSKMSGPWKESLVGQIGYTVSCDFLTSMKTGHMSFKTLKKLMAARIPIPFIMGKHTKDAATGEYSSSEELVKGNAIITSLNLKADNGALVTSSIGLQGTGPLEDGIAVGG